MITNGLILVGAILAIVATVVFLLAMAKAPEAVEDETGFHRQKVLTGVPPRYYSAKRVPSVPAKVAKSFKPQLPTASAVPWDF